MLVLALVAVFLPHASASDPAALADQFVSRVAMESKIPGLAVGVVKNGTTVFARGYGVKFYGGEDSVDEHTMFQMGSCTKTFIAMGLAHFVGIGAITWDTTVHNITKGRFNASVEYLTANMNVGDLLSHRTGYGDHDGDLLWALGDVETETDLVEKRVPFLQPTKSLRQLFMYSNIGYEVATITLEALAGEPWYTFVQQRFLDPLDMGSTVPGLPAVTSKQAPRVSGGHKGVPGPEYKSTTDTPLIDSFDLNHPLTPSLTGGISNGFLGAGSMLSSASDYCKWMAYLLNSSRWSSPTAVMEAEAGQMIIPQAWATAFMGLGIEQPGNAMAAGFGFDVVGDLFHGERFFTKGGDSLFHQTRTGMLPGSGIAAVVFANMESYPTSSYYVNGIRNALLQIFSGTDMSTVEADWSKLEMEIREVKDLMQGMPTVESVVPLRADKNVTITSKAYHGQLLITKHQVDQVVAATATEGLPPKGVATNLTGSFRDGYAGLLQVSSLSDNRLVVHYGCLWCVLAALPDEPGDVFLCPNGTRHTAMFPGFTPFVYNHGADAWQFGGLSFSRAGQRRARVLEGLSKSKEWRSSLTQSPYMSLSST
eukprot:TRINITY_DN19583_c0_g1_i2.p1 TRINITY_DN19583_c0_g1~~TRINITY_DN19583_c0_g1_i2.p1  ORF type:complete len:594 (+),score=121.41 TRINITY_DN19583_c0_g1_i2:234-2015(+)